jgi:hypothetical protein
MLFRAQGAQVAVVGPDSKVQLRQLNIGKDYGTSLEILSGLSVDDQVIINPPDSLEEGQQVNVAATPSPGQGPMQTQPQNPQQEENAPQQEGNPQGGQKGSGQ